MLSPITMDIARPDIKQKKNRQTLLWTGAAVVAIAVLAVIVLRLKPAAPTVDRSTIWTDTVKRGPLVRQVRSSTGVLAPREDSIELIPAQTDATVVRIRILPGTQVTSDTIIMDLTDPQLEQEVLNARLVLNAANALADLLQKHRVRSLEATALLARILEVMHAPLFAFDRENRLQLVNSAGLKLLDRPSARCIGHSATELRLDDLLGAPDQSIHSFNANPKTPTSSSRWLLRKAAFRQDGAPHTLLLLADVSLPLQEEEQRSWKRLIRVLGHELSNSLAPIKSIAGSLWMQAEDMKGDEGIVRDFRRGLRVIESRADALHRFVQSYRKLAQLPSPQLRPVLLGPLLERVVLLEQRLPIQLDSGPAAVLHADPDQLEQMFINLLTNAVDASMDNGAQAVRATWQLAGASVSVVIEDRGLGLANTENLFVPFYTTKPSGSGVGLALAQQIARAHGGEITLVNRDDGEGARAVVHLPMAQS